MKLTERYQHVLRSHNKTNGDKCLISMTKYNLHIMVIRVWMKIQDIWKEHGHLKGTGGSVLWVSQGRNRGIGTATFFSGSSEDETTFILLQVFGKIQFHAAAGLSLFLCWLLTSGHSVSRGNHILWFMVPSKSAMAGWVLLTIRLSLTHTPSQFISDSSAFYC